MRWLSIGLGLVAVSVLAIYLWLGPLYTYYDDCDCGRRRQWKEFSECPQLHGKVFSLRVTSEGSPSHQHQYWDPQYEQSGDWVRFIVLGFSVAAVIVEPRRRGLAPKSS